MELKGGGGGGGGGGRERLTAFVPASDCRFNCHSMIYLSEVKLIVCLQTFSCWRPLCSVAPLFLSPAGGAIAPLATTPLDETKKEHEDYQLVKTRFENHFVKR